MLVVDALGDQLERVGVDAAHAVLEHALAQDRQARAEVGRLDVAHQAGLEALAQPVLERAHVARRAGRRSARAGAPASCSALKVWKNSSSVLALRCEELDVVDEQDVDAAVGGS